MASSAGFGRRAMNCRDRSHLSRRNRVRNAAACPLPARDRLFVGRRLCCGRGLLRRGGRRRWPCCGCLRFCGGRRGVFCGRWQWRTGWRGARGQRPGLADVDGNAEQAPLAVDRREQNVWPRSLVARNCMLRPSLRRVSTVLVAPWRRCGTRFHRQVGRAALARQQ